MKRRIGYAPGVYDLFHVGHLNLLARARERCDHLIAGVVSDELATRAKGRGPVVTFDERRATWDAKGEATVARVAEVLKRYPNLKHVDVRLPVLGLGQRADRLDELDPDGK